jgi:hypothetical protein
VLSQGILLLSIINIIDMGRTVSLITSALLFHCYCLRRARLLRQGRAVAFQERVSRDVILSDIESYYRRRLVNG